ncbi:MAG: hypothetical protein JSU96_15020 [Acidobacteriota bacterium]|nr:MAG: hypothetical protein JSU96_15020 [Acidobacteriota bacterium]
MSSKVLSGGGSLATSLPVSARPGEEAGGHMGAIRTIPFVLLSAFWIVTVQGGIAGQDNRAAGTPSSVSPTPLQVPLGDGTPVLTDGLFSEGEWTDASSIELNSHVRLYFKQFRGVVFIGIRGRRQNGIGPSELSITAGGGPIHVLHVSLQLGEIVLPESGEAPPYRFGLTPGWYANEQRRDADEAKRLEQAGKSPIEVMTASAYPSDGIEFAIRRSKFPAQCWSIRLGISYLDGEKPSWMNYPTESVERSSERWQLVCFE